jgi:hypothetical protein
MRFSTALAISSALPFGVRVFSLVLALSSVALAQETVFIANTKGGTSTPSAVMRVPASGGAPTLVTSMSSSPSLDLVRIDVDADHNTLWFTGNGWGPFGLWRMDLDGSNRQLVLSSLSPISALNVGEETGIIYFAQPNDGLLRSMRTDGSELKDILTGVTVIDVVFDELRNKLSYLEQNSNEIRLARMDGSTLRTQVLSDYPQALAHDSNTDNDYVVTTDYFSRTQVLRIDWFAPAPQVVATLPSGTRVRDLDISADGRTLFAAIANGSSSSVLAIDVATGSSWTLAGPLYFTASVATHAPPAGQKPWRQGAEGTRVGGISWNYTMGYHFTPLRHGYVTGLGGDFQGPKLVHLWNRTTGAGSIAYRVEGASSGFTYRPTTSVPVRASQGYTVGVTLGGSGGSYRYALSTPLPRTIGDVRIDASTYIAGDARPTNSVTTVMYGQADIRFEPASLQHPWQQAENGNLSTGLSYSNYLFGYEFTPRKHSDAFALGAKVQGPATVILFESATQTELARVDVLGTSQSEYTYVTLPLTAFLQAGQRYVVAVWLSGDELSTLRMNTAPFPIASGDVVIERMVYDWEQRFPRGTLFHMFGQADVEFAVRP